MKKILFLLSFVAILLPSFTFATTTPKFKTEVIDVTDTFIRVEDKDGKRYTITEEIELPDTVTLKPGDRVFLQQFENENGESFYNITGIVRDRVIFFLVFLFALTVWLVNRKHGIRSLVNLIVTLGIVFIGIIPLILKGLSPVLITIIGATLAMTWSIYFSHGFNKKSHSAVVSIAASLTLVGILSWLFINLTGLSGFAEEEAGILVGLGYGNINMHGLLLAAIIIGAMGVLDDLAISQVSVVQEIQQASPAISKKALFQSAFRVGQDHTSAIVNTLVLAYAGAAFPLLILFTLGEAPFDTFNNIINNEIVATELVRTLVGSIGILLSMPISTFIAISAFTKK